MEVGFPQSEVADGDFFSPDARQTDVCVQLSDVEQCVGVAPPCKYLFQTEAQWEFQRKAADVRLYARRPFRIFHDFPFCIPLYGRQVDGEERAEKKQGCRQEYPQEVFDGFSHVCFPLITGLPNLPEVCWARLTKHVEQGYVFYSGRVSSHPMFCSTPKPALISEAGTG
ncbi:hypothetical protein [Odoribacter lunatus]|uniref:hypothetical protein n=1 Tax=Odoribacter lunatus TaxID=2941335 RepID=UPI00203F6C56|nr:hypothetical protein [Odoribacter lunatus]